MPLASTFNLISWRAAIAIGGAVLTWQTLDAASVATSTPAALDVAASLGAREASLPGATPARVQQVVREALAPFRLEDRIDPVSIEPPHPGDLPTGSLIRVTVGLSGSVRDASHSATHVARKE